MFFKGLKKKSKIIILFNDLSSQVYKNNTKIMAFMQFHVWNQSLFLFGNASILNLYVYFSFIVHKVKICHE